MIKLTEAEIKKNWIGDKVIVSICSITYNHEKFIAMALDSFLEQKTTFPFEIVISDDCSTDNTAKIIQKYVEKFPNIIKANLRSKNVGMIKNGIENLQRANGKYIALCEGDDYWSDENKLKIQVDFLEQNRDYSGVYNRVCYVGSNLRNNIQVDSNIDTIDYRELIQQQYMIHTCSFIFKKKILSNDIYKLLSVAPIGDRVIFIKAGMDGKIRYFNNVMSVYRVGSGVMSTWKQAKSTETLLELYTLFEQNKSFKKIIHSVRVSKRFYYWKLSNIYAEERHYLLSFKNYLYMLYYTLYVFTYQEGEVIRKVNFSEYIKTPIRAIPYSLDFFRKINTFLTR